MMTTEPRRMASYPQARSAFLRLAITALPLVAGCTRYVLVQSTLQVGPEPTAEVTASPAWRDLSSRIRQVALYAPDDCANLSTSAATGAAVGAGTVLQTHCGVEMSELERALTAEGYVVSSWMTLHRMVTTDHMTPLDAARRLGAQVLFQVNSLERSRRTRPMEGAQWVREFRQADEDGAPGAPAALSTQDAARLRAMVAPYEHQFTDGERLGVGLDVNAVLVSSGQTIWFYRWTRVEPLPPNVRLALLFAQGNGPWMRHAHFAQREEGDANAQEAEAVSTQGSPENRVADAYHALVREVIRDFVARFRGGAST